MFGRFKKATMVPAEQALPGRAVATMPVPTTHHVNGNPIQGPWADELQTAMFGLGCFWGAERKFWPMPGVFSTAAGYTAGQPPNPTYEEVCSGNTGHNEVVLVVFDPGVVSYEQLLAVFFESHNPTQGMQQGNDVGTQYRSGIYVRPEQRQVAEAALQAYGARLAEAGHGDITTEVVDAAQFFYAEAYHQQYLSKNPGGYCGLGGTGVSCPIGVLETPAE